MSVRNESDPVVKPARTLRLVPDAPVRGTRPPAAGLLIALNVIQGFGAVGGGIWLLFHRNGVTGMPASWLDRFPFHDYLIPGLVLSIALGIGPLVVAFGLWKRPAWRWTRFLVGWTHEHWSWAGAALVALGLIAWIGLEVGLTPAKSFLQISFGVVGLAMAVLVALPSVRHFYSER